MGRLKDWQLKEGEPIIRQVEELAKKIEAEVAVDGFMEIDTAEALADLLRKWTQKFPGDQCLTLTEITNAAVGRGLAKLTLNWVRQGSKVGRQ